jgi:deoxyribodipyrimidine photo-lyase
MSTSVWWVRRDLRLTDNTALTAALSASEAVLPIFVLDRRLLQSRYNGEKRTAFLLAGLRALDADLRARGSRLLVRSGDPAQVLTQVCAETQAAAVFAARDYSPFAVRRDAEVAAALGVPLYLHAGIAARPPESIVKDDGKPFVVYAPFSKRWRRAEPLRRSDILPAPQSICTPEQPPGEALPNAPVLPASIPFAAGEAEANRRLAAFVTGEAAPVFAYGKLRNQLGAQVTAQLSPYLRWGILSPRLATLAAYEAIEQASEKSGAGAEEARKSTDTWLAELIWRDFCFAILHHFPHVRSGSFRPQHDKLAWRNGEEEFQAWCEGRTGYPIVDAAMRQLAAQGWMHNRSRLISASFLVKDLLIDWRWGERFFMQQLIDGDPAVNNYNWQWVASTGADAAPHFRVFNPVEQGARFDPDGTYVRRWLPELQHVPLKFLQQPWQMSRSEQIKSRCVVGEDYPAPIVDHHTARERVLEAYRLNRDMQES